LVPALLVWRITALSSEKDWAAFAGLVGGIGAGITLTTIVGMPILIAATPMFLIQKGAHAAFKDCARTIGCWPQEGSRSNANLCSMRSSARDGGSPVWFMPPPGTQLQAESGQTCKLKACSGDDTILQYVGYDGTSVKNCQPLPYHEMSSSQRQKFLESIRDSCVDETNCDDVRGQHVKSIVVLVNSISSLQA